jgi:Flp pilus assembly protein TadD
MGQTDAGLAAVYRAVALDPLNWHSQYALGSALIDIRNDEAIAAFTKAKALAPNNVFVTAWLGFAYIANGNLEAARTTCEGIKIADDFNRLFCLVWLYDKLGRQADAEAMATAV